MKYTLEEIKGYLESKITYSWYQNSEIDYGVKGAFINAQIIGNKHLSIEWWEQEENKGKKTFSTTIAWFEDYTPEQMYGIWMEADWEEVAA